METLQDVLRRMLIQHLERQAQRKGDADRDTSQNSSNPTTTKPHEEI
jgi:hypothetical protein